MSNEKSSNVRKNEKKAEKNMLNPNFMGVFWIMVGIGLISLNFFPSDSAVYKLIIQLGMLCAGIYLIVVALLGFVRKSYFIFGIFLVALWLGKMISLSSTGAYKIVWPISMFAFSIGIIVYGFVFKKKKATRYTITGIIFIVFSVLVMLAASRAFSLSKLMQKTWPIFLVLLGISHIRQNKNISKDNNQEDDSEDAVSKKESAVNNESFTEENLQ